MRHQSVALIGGSGFIGSHLANALVAAGNVGGDGERDAVAARLDDRDETTRELAAWALARIEGRDA